MKFYMLVGLPGTGKTTYRNHLMKFHRRIGWQIVSPDDYLDAQAKRLKRTYDEVFDRFADEANLYAYSFCKRMIDNRYPIIVDRTNLTIGSRKKFLELVPDNWEKVAIVFPVPKNHNQRLKSREGKTIPEDVMLNMRDSFVYPTIKEGFDEVREWKFEFNNETPELDKTESR